MSPLVQVVIVCRHTGASPFIEQMIIQSTDARMRHHASLI